MFYRYEARVDGDWVGIFSVFSPSQRRRIGRKLCEPKWYANHPDINSRCWFTEHGYQKFKGVIETEIEEVRYYHPNWQFRIITKQTLDHVAMLGKIQCIEQIV